MDNEIVFHEERRINAVHFESKKTFSQYLYKLQRYCDNLDTEDKASIMIDVQIRRLWKNCIFIWDIFHLEFNDKKLISAITKYVEKNVYRTVNSTGIFWTVIENVSVLLKII